jgi:hypothetical protein
VSKEISVGPVGEVLEPARRINDVHTRSVSESQYQPRS